MRTLAMGVFLSLCVVNPVDAFDVTSCGQEIPQGEVGTLLNDLDCSTGSSAVSMAKRTRLQLNGFSISGTVQVGVFCGAGRCKIEGPGEIRDGFETAILVPFEIRGKVKVTDVDIRNVMEGINGSRATVISNVNVQDSTRPAISGHKLRLENVTVTSSGGDGDVAVEGIRIRAVNVDVSNNDHQGVRAFQKLKGIELTASNNPSYGLVASGRVRLIDSELLGNRALLDGVDIISIREPKLSNTVCGASRMEGGVASWGICLND